MLAIVSQLCFSAAADQGDVARPVTVQQFVEQRGLDCHDTSTAEGGLDLESLSFDLSQRDVFDRWVLDHDRIRDGEMPPPDGAPQALLPIGKSVDWRPNTDPPTSPADEYVLDASKMLHALACALAGQTVTVGDSDFAKRELEAMGVFSGVYSATTKYDFSRIDTPIDGNYRIRFKTYTFMAGPNGADGGDDHGLTGGRRAWWRPDRNVAFAAQRSEPVTLYALSAGGDSRWLTTFDSWPEPSVFECVVALRTGEGIRPDAARLVRTRPGWSGNPNATKEGVPGFAMNWLEVEGPLHEDWPPASYQALFGDLPFEVSEERQWSLTSGRRWVALVKRF